MNEVRIYLTAFRVGQLARLANNELRCNTYSATTNPIAHDAWRDGWLYENSMEHWRLTRKARELARNQQPSSDKRAHSACKYL